MTQDRTQPCGKGKVNFGTHLHLADAAQLILDRVFDRDDILVARVNSVECGVQRRCFARPRRSRDQDNAVALANESLDTRQIAAAEPQFFQT